MQTHNKDVKLNSILKILVTQLTQTCSCQLSVKYVGRGNLTCGDRTTDRVILQGQLIGTQGSNSTNLHAQLQNWVDNGPTVEVNGIQLQIVPCSTYPGGKVTCVLEVPSSTPSISVVSVVDSVGQSSSKPGGILLYVAVAGGVALLLIIAVVIIVLVIVVRKKNRIKR